MFMGVLYIANIASEAEKIRCFFENFIYSILDRMIKNLKNEGYQFSEDRGNNISAWTSALLV